MRKLAARRADLRVVEPAVRKIVEDVRNNGERALRKYAAKWDGLKPGQPLRVRDAELKAAWKNAMPEFREALQIAARNIRQFCEWQKPKEWRRARNGITLGQLVRPLESVGCYVPGGRHPLVSTLLMTVIPAQVAGVKHIRVVSPQAKPEVLAAAGMLGVREFYRAGGAQAVAALAYGTAGIPRVDKIVGPGNSFVTAAKKVVAFDCSIDFLAGPTEALILSSRGKPRFIAADLVAQAEHDPDAVAVLVTTSKNLAAEVAATAESASHENSLLAALALKKNGAILVAGSRKQALAWANEIAPEHITVDREDLEEVSHAGSVFVGDYSAQAAGDYAAGPNHVLPTAGVARFRGGLSVFDFVKVITVQEVSANGLRRIAPAVQRLAKAEGLETHAESIRVRVAHA